MSVKFEDNSSKFKEEKDKLIEAALEAIGQAAEGYAKRMAPTDTGLLKNSITHAVGGHPTKISRYTDDKGNQERWYEGAPGEEGDETVYIGSNVEYAAYQEYGTRRTKAQPFLQPMLEHIDEYKEIAETYLKGG